MHVYFLPTAAILAFLPLPPLSVSFPSALVSIEETPNQYHIPFSPKTHNVPSPPTFNFHPQQITYRDTLLSRRDAFLGFSLPTFAKPQPPAPTPPSPPPSPPPPSPPSSTNPSPPASSARKLQPLRSISTYHLLQSPWSDDSIGLWRRSQISDAIAPKPHEKPILSAREPAPPRGRPCLPPGRPRLPPGRPRPPPGRPRLPPGRPRPPPGSPPQSVRPLAPGPPRPPLSKRIYFGFPSHFLSPQNSYDPESDALSRHSRISNTKKGTSKKKPVLSARGPAPPPGSQRPPVAKLPSSRLAYAHESQNIDDPKNAGLLRRRRISDAIAAVLHMKPIPSAHDPAPSPGFQPPSPKLLSPLPPYAHQIQNVEDPENEELWRRGRISNAIAAKLDQKLNSSMREPAPPFISSRLSSSKSSHSSSSKSSHLSSSSESSHSPRPESSRPPSPPPIDLGSNLHAEYHTAQNLFDPDSTGLWRRSRISDAVAAESHQKPILSTREPALPRPGKKPSYSLNPQDTRDPESAGLSRRSQNSDAIAIISHKKPIFPASSSLQFTPSRHVKKPPLSKTSPAKLQHSSNPLAQSFGTPKPADNAATLRAPQSLKSTSLKHPKAGSSTAGHPTSAIQPVESWSDDSQIAASQNMDDNPFYLTAQESSGSEHLNLVFGRSLSRTERGMGDSRPVPATSPPSGFGNMLPHPAPRPNPLINDVSGLRARLHHQAKPGRIQPPTEANFDSLSAASQSTLQQIILEKKGRRSLILERQGFRRPNQAFPPNTKGGTSWTNGPPNVNEKKKGPKSPSENETEIRTQNPTGKVETKENGNLDAKPPPPAPLEPDAGSPSDEQSSPSTAIV